MSSSTLLCLAAFVCLLSLVSGQAQIARVIYTGDNCSGTSFNTTTAAGTCQGAGGVYSASYCSTDGSKIYTFAYSDASCNASYAFAVTEYPTTCGFSVSSKYQQVCVNAAAGPAAPMSFPPSGWSTSVSCVNSTDSYKAATVCSAGTDATIKCTNSAANSALCRKTGLASTPSTNGGCSADGANSVSVLYSDDKCGTVVQATVQKIGCNKGVQVTCGGNSVPSLPNKGYTQYDNDACTPNANNAPSTVLFSDACVNSQTFACSTVNSTTSGTWTAFLDPTGKGLCPASGAQTPTIQAVGVCMKGKIFTCNFAPSGGNSAAAASVSFVAMIVAAFVALVASRSL